MSPYHRKREVPLYEVLGPDEWTTVKAVAAGCCMTSRLGDLPLKGLCRLQEGTEITSVPFLTPLQCARTGIS
jgi:hypothetical protein